MKKIDLITGDVPFFKKLFQGRKDQETKELEKVWKILDMVDEPPKVYRGSSVKKYLYPSCALGIIGLLIGLYFGVKTEPYNDYYTIAQEVINYGE